MKRFYGFLHSLTLVVLGSLVLADLAFLTIFIPAASSSMAQQFDQYKNDVTAIGALLSAPAVISEIILVIIGALLVRIRTDRMFSEGANKWVRYLAISSVALAVSFACIIAWLDSKNTLPPIVWATLGAAALLALAVALVTANLQTLLHRATAASKEVEGLI